MGAGADQQWQPTSRSADGVAGRLPEDLPMEDVQVPRQVLETHVRVDLAPIRRQRAVRRTGCPAGPVESRAVLWIEGDGVASAGLRTSSPSIGDRYLERCSSIERPGEIPTTRPPFAFAPRTAS